MIWFVYTGGFFLERKHIEASKYRRRTWGCFLDRENFARSLESINSRFNEIDIVHNFHCFSLISTNGSNNLLFYHSALSMLLIFSFSALNLFSSCRSYHPQAGLIQGQVSFIHIKLSMLQVSFKGGSLLRIYGNFLFHFKINSSFQR